MLAAQNLFGAMYLFGVAKGKATKRNNYKLSFSTEDAWNIIEPTRDDPPFLRRNVVSIGIDLMHCKGVGGKVWLRFRSRVARNTYFIQNLMTTLSEDPSINESTDDNSNDRIRIVPRVAILYYDTCSVRVQYIHSNSSVECAVL